MAKVIEIHIIYADEAKGLMESSLEKMRCALSDLVQNLDELAVKNVVRNDNMIHDSLDEIRTHVTKLQEYISDNRAETLDGTQLSQHARGIVELFMQLDRDPSRDTMLREAIILAETKAVLANAHAREIMAVEPFLERQPGSDVDWGNWSVPGVRIRLAEEFQARFPVFLGYKIEISKSGNGFWIYISETFIAPLISDHRKNALKALALKAREFLERELVNEPRRFFLHVLYAEEFGPNREYAKGRIFCEVRLPREDALESWCD